MVKLSDMWMRDPFLVSTTDVKDSLLGSTGLPPPRGGGRSAATAGKRFWLYGTTDAPPADVGPYSEYPATGFNCYCSDDLDDWEGPFEAFRPSPAFYDKFNCQYWACEVWLMGGRLFMFATMKRSGKDNERGVIILESPSGHPEGPFVPLTGEPITPSSWACLDGTLHVESDKPYMVFCREWTQVGDGQMCAVELAPDLCSTKGTPFTLFSASQAPWSKHFNSSTSSHASNFITDGPFLHRCSSSGELIMLWSSIGLNDQYCVGIARSTSGSVYGPWVHDPKPLFYNDGGHAMLAKVSLRRQGSTKPGARAEHSLLILALHSPNRNVRKSAPRLVGVIEEREEQTGLAKLDWFEFQPARK